MTRKQLKEGLADAVKNLSGKKIRDLNLKGKQCYLSVCMDKALFILVTNTYEDDVDYAHDLIMRLDGLAGYFGSDFLAEEE